MKAKYKEGDQVRCPVLVLNSESKFVEGTQIVVATIVQVQESSSSDVEHLYTVQSSGVYWTRLERELCPLEESEFEEKKWRLPNCYGEPKE